MKHSDKQQTKLQNNQWRIHWEYITYTGNEGSESTVKHGNYKSLGIQNYRRWDIKSQKYSISSNPLHFTDEDTEVQCIALPGR